MKHERIGLYCACGFYPSSMSDQPGETLALHICRMNDDCRAPSECRIFARCAHRREHFYWLDCETYLVELENIIGREQTY